MWDVSGVEFNDCLFSSEMQPTFSKSYGIRSIDAAYTVHNQCHFKDLYYGILAEGVNDNTPEIIIGDKNIEYHFLPTANIFEGNQFGLALLSTENTFVKGNNFLPNGGSDVGLYCESTLTPYIEYNKFTGSGYGILLRNTSKKLEYRVYNNTFDDLAYGIMAHGANPQAKLNCNNNTDVTYNISVLGFINEDEELIKGSIHYIQEGVIDGGNDAAGNNFSTCDNTNTHIYTEANATEHFTYYYDNSANHEPTCTANANFTKSESGVLDCSAILGGGIMDNGKVVDENTLNNLMNDINLTETNLNNDPYNVSLRNQLDSLREEYNSSLYLSVRYYMSEEKTDSALLLLESQTDPLAYELATPIYLRQQDTLKAEDILSHYAMNTVNDSNFVRFYSVQLDLTKANKTYFDMDSLQKTVYQEIAKTDADYATYSRTILSWIDDSLDYDIEVPEINSSGSAKREGIHNEVSGQENEYRIWFDKEALNIIVPNGNDKVFDLTIYDINGKVVLEKKNLSSSEVQLPLSIYNGIYIAAIRENKVINYRNKFTVIR